MSAVPWWAWILVVLALVLLVDHRIVTGRAGRVGDKARARTRIAPVASRCTVPGCRWPSGTADHLDPVLSPAELRAARRLTGLYPEAFLQLLSEESRSDQAAPADEAAAK